MPRTVSMRGDVQLPAGPDEQWERAGYSEWQPLQIRISYSVCASNTSKRAPKTPLGGAAR